jgi:acyl-CoA synthetase (NDP forming)
LLVGLGGVWAEGLQDVVLMSPDLTRSEIITQLRKLKAARLFDGYRGQPKLDINAVADVIEKLSGVALKNPNITEIDINPLNVYEQGRGALILDALIVTRD